MARLQDDRTVGWRIEVRPAALGDWLLRVKKRCVSNAGGMRRLNE
jgi:hypothetical protein